MNQEPENPFKVGDSIRDKTTLRRYRVGQISGHLVLLESINSWLDYRDLEITHTQRVWHDPTLMERPDNKPTNPKTAFGSDKLPLHLWPPVATALGSLALLDGALRYGRSNYRAAGARATIYADAAQRHMDAYMEGENLDPQSGVSHLGHALACLAILVDAEAAGVLTDDRRYPGKYRESMDALTPHVARIKARHVGEEPKHYTIGDVV